MKTDSDLVLIVDDDKHAREFLRISLGKAGYNTVTASNALDARKVLQAGNLDSVVCVLTDYHMPNENGLSLLTWIRKTDADLATILVTCVDERELITQSFREGAHDFLQKPVDRAKLHAAVARAVERTKFQRARALAHGEVQTLARTQKRILAATHARGVAKLEICSFPKSEAGGDFFSHVEKGPGRQLFILTDVSGHDIQAAYISAYFHGMLRGMLARGTPTKEVIEYFNDFLVNQWNRHDPAEGGSLLPTSVAIAAILLDSETQTARIWNHGAPAPVYMSKAGAIETDTTLGGAPLGWFADVSAEGRTRPAGGGDLFLMWTDGLSDVAEREGVSPLSLAFAYRKAQERGATLRLLTKGADDILLAAIRLEGDGEEERFEPILLETYDGGQYAQIDEMQTRWERSLLLAAPEIPDACMHNILLATRECILNALLHGCRKLENETATLDVSFCPAQGTVRVHVRDSGPGYDFDFAAHEARSRVELVQDHRGLLLIKHLASAVSFEAAGQGVIMTFRTDAEFFNTL